MRGEGIKEKRMGKGKKELRTDSSILKLDIKKKQNTAFSSISWPEIAKQLFSCINISIVNIKASSEYRRDAGTESTASEGSGSRRSAESFEVILFSATLS